MSQAWDRAGGWCLYLGNGSGEWGGGQEGCGWGGWRGAGGMSGMLRALRREDIIKY